MKRKTTEQHTLVQPPIQQNVRTNIGHRFLALVVKHFPKDCKLRKMINYCNTIKISYSCMKSTKQIIDNHNKHICNSSKHVDDTTDNTNTKDTKMRSCRQRNTCPLNVNCLQSSIYQAIVTCKNNNITETYIRLTENDFKTRYKTTPHYSNTQNTETLPNSANISGPLKKITLTTLFHGTSLHQDPRTTAQAKDVTSASKKNYL